MIFMFRYLGGFFDFCEDLEDCPCFDLDRVFGGPE